MRDTKHLGKHANKLAEKAKEKALFRAQRKAVEAQPPLTLRRLALLRTAQQRSYRQPRRWPQRDPPDLVAHRDGEAGDACRTPADWLRLGVVGAAGTDEGREAGVAQQHADAAAALQAMQQQAESQQESTLGLDDEF